VNFVIRRGIPEIEKFWSDLDQKLASGTLSKTEARLLRKLVKIAGFLAANPFPQQLAVSRNRSTHPPLRPQVFQSYLENQTPAAGRMFWVYGPGEREITSGSNLTPRTRKAGVMSAYRFRPCLLAAVEALYDTASPSSRSTMTTSRQVPSSFAWRR
jgi:hypothetical protein